MINQNCDRKNTKFLFRKKGKYWAYNTVMLPLKRCGFPFRSVHRMI